MSLHNQKAICPKDSTHVEFNAGAHVTETWLIDEYGNFIRTQNTGDEVTTHEPDSDDLWTCAECGAEAEFVNT